MRNSLYVVLFVINAFFHMTNANSYSRSYERHTGNGYPDSSGSYVTNFGNGNNKHNFVNVDENPDGLYLSGTSVSNDPRHGPSVDKINVDFNNPNYRGGPQGPSVNYNPRATRTQITNIGNGEENRNVFVFNDNRDDPPYTRNNQDGTNGYRGKPNYRHQGNTRVITNIGRGPDNTNNFYVNGKRVYPQAVNKNGVQETSVISESLPRGNNDGQIRQLTGEGPYNKFNKPNGVTRNYETRNQAGIPNGYTKYNYPTYNYNEGTIVNSDFPNVVDDPSLKELPLRKTK